MESLIVHPKNKKQLSALKTFITAFKISFEEKVDNKSTYNREFIEKINRSESDFEAGNYKVVKTEDLWK